jgi:hypothetical protein
MVANATDNETISFKENRYCVRDGTKRMKTIGDSVKKLIGVLVLMVAACDSGTQVDTVDSFTGTYQLSAVNGKNVPAHIGQQLPPDSVFVTSGTLVIQNRRYTLSIYNRVGAEQPVRWFYDNGSVTEEVGGFGLQPDLWTRAKMSIAMASPGVRVVEPVGSANYEYRFSKQ